MDWTSPVAEGLNPLFDSVRVDISLSNQTIPSLNDSLNAMQVELHGGGEVLVLLDGGLYRLHCSGQLYMS